MPATPYTKEEWHVRKELAAAYQLVAHYGWNDLVFTHLSARVPGPGYHFISNTFCLLIASITPSSLVKVEQEGTMVDAHSDHSINRAGFSIHSAVHMAL